MEINATPIAAQRLRNCPPYPFAAVAKRLRELEKLGHDIIQLDIGSPDLPPPPVVIEALLRSAQNPAHHGYGGFTGIPALRKAFAAHYARRFEVELDPEAEVLPLIGSKEGIVNLHLAVVNPGDVVLVPDPGYIAYERGVLLAGGEPHLVPLDPSRGYLPSLDKIPADILRRARVLWINYPNNPTGAVATIDALAEIVSFCREHQIILCSDNPYSDVTFDGFRAPSVLQVPGALAVAVEFNSVSKTFNMAGWRVGVCVGNREIVDALACVKSNIDSGMFRAVQDAATAALTEVSDEWIAERNMVYQRRRDIVIGGLAGAGLSAPPPAASLYVWAAVEAGDDVTYVRHALEEAHVSMSPGSFYGPAGRGYVRLSLVVPEERLRAAMRRLAEWHAD